MLYSRFIANTLFSCYGRNIVRHAGKAVPSVSTDGADALMINVCGTWVQQEWPVECFHFCNPEDEQVHESIKVAKPLFEKTTFPGISLV